MKTPRAHTLVSDDPLLEHVTIEWPDGEISTFDGETWEGSEDWDALLDQIPITVSVMLEHWRYWHALTVAHDVGAEVIGEGWPDEPTLVSDLVMPDDLPTEDDANE